MGGKNKQTKLLAESMVENVLADEAPRPTYNNLDLWQKTCLLKKSLGIDARMPIIPCVDAAYAMLGLEKSEGATLIQNVDILLDLFFSC